MSAAEPLEPIDVTEVGETASVHPLPSSTEVELHEQSYLPAPSEWTIMLQQADVLAASDLVPTAYRRKPANVVLATLAGRPFGWDVSMSMRSFHIIEGVPTMKPEIILALVRKAGHSVKGSSAWNGASVTGVRCDNGDTFSTEFTIQDAVRAGLCTLDDKGQPFARSDRGKKLPWEQYPESMCWARCVSKLARMLFSDVLLGAAYVPEEMNVWVDESGEPIDVGEKPTWVESTATKEPEMMDDAIATALTARAQALPQEAKADLKAQMFERDIRGSFFSQTASKVRILEPMIAAFEKRAAAGEWGDWQPLAPPVPVDANGEVTPEPTPIDVPDKPAPSVPTAADVDDTWDAARLATLELTELVKVDAGILIDACHEWGVEITDDMTPMMLAAAFDAKATEGF